MGSDSEGRIFSVVLPLTVIDYPNQFLGGRVLTQSGAESMVGTFAGGVQCLFHTLDGDVVMDVEELTITEGQLVAKAVTPSIDNKERLTGCITEDIEPEVRMDLAIRLDPITRAVPDRIDAAKLVKVHVNLMPRQ